MLPLVKMLNTPTDFYGKQEGERILYLIKPHSLALIFTLVRICLAALVILIAFVLIGQATGSPALFVFLGIIVALVMIAIGAYLAKTAFGRNKTYLTDRRIIRFEPTTFFATNTRSLTWDEVVKVKTYPANFIFKQLKIGNVIIHARTTVRTADEEITNKVTVDDIEMKQVYYYRDLGNYIDKILFTYKQMPAGVKDIKPFVPKPKGKRD